MLFLDGNAEYFRKKDGSSKAQKKGVKGTLLFIVFSPEQVKGKEYCEPDSSGRMGKRGD